MLDRIELSDLLILEFVTLCQVSRIISRGGLLIYSNDSWFSILYIC